MPIYEFECPVHGKFSQMFPLSQYEETKDGIMCDLQLEGEENLYCGEIASKVVSLPSPPYLGKPTPIFVNKRTGDRQVATSQYDIPPRGYVRDELKGTAERSKFEKEETFKANIEAQFETQRIRNKSDALRKERHDNMIATMNAKQVDINPDTGEKIEYHMDHNTQALLKKAMNRSAKRNRIPTKRIEKRFAVNHMDSSNIQDAPK